MTKAFDWAEAQKRELDWWVQWQSKEKPEFGKGGLSRYPVYMELFGPHFSTDSILDVGSGAFPLVNWLDHCSRRASLDPLNSQFKEQGFPQNPGVEYVDGLAEKIPFPDQSFDQVLLFNMLDHLEDWTMAVAEALRVARRSVLIHVHIDGPFASDGMHKVLREPDLVASLEGRWGGQRLALVYPAEHRSLPRRLASTVKKALLGRGHGWKIRQEKSWAGILRKNSVV